MHLRSYSSEGTTKFLTWTWTWNIVHSWHKQQSSVNSTNKKHHFTKITLHDDTESSCHPAIYQSKQKTLLFCYTNAYWEKLSQKRTEEMWWRVPK